MEGFVSAMKVKARVRRSRRRYRTTDCGVLCKTMRFSKGNGPAVMYKFLRVRSLDHLMALHLVDLAGT